MATPSPLEPGQIIGQYRIVRKIGEGGFGAVFECVHQTIDRRAALKVLHLELGATLGLAGRFLNEARAANRVPHPGVVQVFDCGQLPDGMLWLLMEYVDGETLHARLDAACQAPPYALGMDALPVLHQLAAILSVAHQRGIVHRDLKPSNVMLVSDPVVRGGDRVRLLDFGIAKLLGEAVEAGHKAHAVPRTEAGTFLGTPAYMAPEQARSAGDVNDRADVFALGVMAYQAVTGRLPWDGPTPFAIIMLKATEVPAPPRDINPEVPPELDRQIQAMISLDPNARPSMAEVEREWDDMLGPSVPWRQRRSTVKVPSPSPTPEERGGAVGAGIRPPPRALQTAAGVERSPSPASSPYGTANIGASGSVPPTFAPLGSASAPEGSTARPVAAFSLSPPVIAPSFTPAIPPKLPIPGLVVAVIVLVIAGLLGAVLVRTQGQTHRVLSDASLGQAASDSSTLATGSPADMADPPPDLQVPMLDLSAPARDFVLSPRDFGVEVAKKKSPVMHCMVPRTTCIKASVSPDIKEHIAGAFVDAQIELCQSERLVVYIHDNEAIFAEVPTRLRPDERNSLRVALRGRLPSTRVTTTVEIQCKR